MTGRSHHMDASRAAQSGTATRRSVRGVRGVRGLRGAGLAASALCLLAMLCTVVVHSGRVVHANHQLTHRHGISVAAAVVADGPGNAVRTDQHAVTAASTPATVVALTGTAANESVGSSDLADVHAVRTRGPPGAAAAPIA